MCLRVNPCIRKKSPWNIKSNFCDGFWESLKGVRAVPRFPFQYQSRKRRPLTCKRTHNKRGFLCGVPLYLAWKPASAGRDLESLRLFVDLARSLGGSLAQAAVAAFPALEIGNRLQKVNA